MSSPRVGTDSAQHSHSIFHHRHGLLLFIKGWIFCETGLSQYFVVCASYAEGALTCMSVSLKVIPPRRVPEPPLLNTPMQKAFDSLVCMNR